MKAFGILLLLSSFAHASIPVAITLDDLPAHGATALSQTRLQLTQKLISHLKGKPPVHAFVNGVGITPDGELDLVIREWVNAGHRLANHTFSHSDINTQTPGDYIDEIERNENLYSALGFDLTRIFRYPNLHEGESSIKRDTIRSYLKHQGYKIGHVTIDSGDWAATAPFIRCLRKNDFESIQWMQKELLKFAVKRLHASRDLGKKLANREIPQILLIHASAYESESLPALLDALVREDVTFIPLETALEDPIYQRDTGWVSKDGMTFLDQLALANGTVFPLIPTFPRDKIENLCK